MLFDPYEAWLSIPKDRRPPSHYDLLGLDLFEDDRDKIQTQAKRQFAIVQRRQLGKNQDAARRLLQEIAEAEVTLSNPESKQDYDDQLRADYDRMAAAQLLEPIPDAETLIEEGVDKKAEGEPRDASGGQARAATDGLDQGEQSDASQNRTGERRESRLFRKEDMTPYHRVAFETVVRKKFVTDFAKDPTLKARIHRLASESEDVATAVGAFVERYMANLREDGERRAMWIAGFVAEVQAESERMYDRWAADELGKAIPDTEASIGEAVDTKDAGRTHDTSEAQPPAATDGGAQAEHSDGSEARAGQASLDVSGNLLRVGAKDLQLILQTVRDLGSSKLLTKKDLDDQTQLVIGSSEQCMDDLSKLSALLETMLTTVNTVAASVNGKLLKRAEVTSSTVELLERVLITKYRTEDGDEGVTPRLNQPLQDSIPKILQEISPLKEIKPGIVDGIPKLLEGASKAKEAEEKVQALLDSQAEIKALIELIPGRDDRGDSLEEVRQSVQALHESQAEIKKAVEDIRRRHGHEASLVRIKQDIQSLQDSQTTIIDFIREIRRCLQGLGRSEDGSGQQTQ